jgi:tartrate dehydrogenase/decarboxylase/D-malate dehydrogenase
MTKQTFKIACYPGDGIGLDVTREAFRFLKALEAKLETFHLDVTEFPWGANHFAETGELAPENILEILQPFDAIYLGAVGWPEKLPDHITLRPLIQIRQAFDQYACVRPARLMNNVQSPLAGKGTAEVDFVVVRENSEGEYLNTGGRIRQGTPQEVAIQTSTHTRYGVERILRFSFELARTRRKHLTMITKSNAQRFSFVMWDDIWEEIQRDYPDVETVKQHVDAAAMNFVRCPEAFDVVVASNLFGDILTDLGGVISGGLGLAPSANLNPERKFPSLFEPVHGSAPDIAGKGIANPIAAILSAAMMLDWLDLKEEANTTRKAVESALANGTKTVDLGGTLNTTEMTDAIIECL